MFVDSHCHLDCLNLDKYEGNLESAIQYAREEGIEHMLSISVTLESLSTIRSIAEAHPDIHYSVGVHPCEQDCEEPTLAKLIELGSADKVVGIGETGLDYYWSKENINAQQERFRCHIQAAKQLKKPLIIHTREASEDTLAILKEERAETCGGVMHCFTENWDVAKEALDLGFYISISGIVSFNKAIQVQEVAKKVPLDRLLIETDAPYLAPVPHRGKPNEPAFVKYVAQKIAQLRELSMEEVANVTAKNFYGLFKIKK